MVASAHGPEINGEGEWGKTDMSFARLRLRASPGVVPRAGWPREYHLDREQKQQCTAATTLNASTPDAEQPISFARRLAKTRHRLPRLRRP